jgi:hypothetical protein
MRRFRVRFTMRTAMVLVAVMGLICLGGREVWRKWRDGRLYYPVYPSRVSASAGTQIKMIWTQAQPTPVAITYNFSFGTRKPAPGTTCVLLAEVWFEDVATGLPVVGYSFDAPLTVGGREAASGSLTWDAVIPRPGRYFLYEMLYSTDRAGELRLAKGSGQLYEFVAAAPSIQSPSRAGANP